jgi:hypothetical protein
MWNCAHNGVGMGSWFFGGGIIGFAITILIIIMIAMLMFNSSLF